MLLISYITSLRMLTVTNVMLLLSELVTLNLMLVKVQESQLVRGYETS